MNTRLKELKQEVLQLRMQEDKLLSKRKQIISDIGKVKNVYNCKRSVESVSDFEYRLIKQEINDIQQRLLIHDNQILNLRRFKEYIEGGGALTDYAQMAGITQDRSIDSELLFLDLSIELNMVEIELVKSGVKLQEAERDYDELRQALVLDEKLSGKNSLVTVEYENSKAVKRYLLEENFREVDFGTYIIEHFNQEKPDLGVEYEMMNLHSPFGKLLIDCYKGDRIILNDKGIKDVMVIKDIKYITREE